MPFSKRIRGLSMKGRRNKRMSDSVQTVRNSTKDKERISTKEGNYL